MKKQPVYVFAKWTVKQGQLDAVLKLLPNPIEKSRKEAGNLMYNIYQERSDSNVLFLFEGYADEDALEQHRASDYFQNVIVKQIVPLLERREVQLASEILKA
ncbi:putative quinol monooxygenase [Flavobacterium sp.]|uniref:putative quinol monooxygenase n=1 Tax=Flavobacterium sp. TaxID=239 RepID=UPI0039E4A19C